MKAGVLRKKFLDFFESKKHKIIPSDSLVPKDDPTLLFTTAGMNQFKKQFLGNITDFRCAATSQKCLRTDDLDKVGKTAGHHTFFEMLGNFSFGDYFKKEAISWAWEFLTKILAIPEARLWVSVYHEDSDAYDVWRKQIKVPEEKIVKLGDKENFWPAQAKTNGPNGPCGPCSEIFYDYGPDAGCGRDDCTPACSCGRFVEIWNLVFTQFNRKPDATLEPLPSKNIDTGMGLERLAAVMQGVYNNFDTDLFGGVIESIKKELDLTKPDDEQLFKIRVIADHIRAITFSICDGVNPSNEDRGYVVRKLIRLGVNNYRALGRNKACLYKLVPALADAMKEAYPEVLERRENIAEIIKREEISFLKVVQKYDRIAEDTLKALKKKYPDYSKELTAEVARLSFEWHDTYGYPFDSTALTATNLDVKLDWSILRETFQALMKQQRERSREASAMVGDVFVDSEFKLNLAKTWFNGYERLETDSKIIKIFDKDNTQIKTAKANTDIKVILDRTPFYGESGGQVGDVGFITKQNENASIEVVDAKKIDTVIVHIAKVKRGTFSVDDKVGAIVDCKRRKAVARNHTATHLLQSALRKVLGQHIQQQGSLVAADRLRFDFTHFKQISQEELDRIEDLVNGYIRENTHLDSKEMQLEDAKKAGALAFFAEKYESDVRVVSVGDYSKELCGGTHLHYTGEIGLFKIVNESSIAQGIRRIESLTGEAAYKYIKNQESILIELSDTLKSPEDKLVGLTNKFIAAQKNLEKKINKLYIEMLKKNASDIVEGAKDLDGTKIITEKFDDADMSFLRNAVDLLKRQVKSAVITLGSIKNNKVYIAMGLTPDLVKKGLSAAQMIRDIAGLVKGSGGGRPDFAQAGGDEPEKLNQALAATGKILKERLKK